MFRALASRSASTSTRALTASSARAFHTPFASLSSTQTPAETASASASTTSTVASSAHYEKAYDAGLASQTTTTTTEFEMTRTYVVSPDAPHPAHATGARSDVPSGAYHVATPYA